MKRITRKKPRRSVHFSSKNQEWETPKELFNELDLEFQFTLDAAATKKNAKCGLFFSKKENGLKRSWLGEKVWLNPPYGRQIGHWVAKAAAEYTEGAVTVVMLVPARTDTAWWHDHIWNTALHRPREGRVVRLLRGRLKFGRSKNGAPFPSAIVIFKGAA